MPSKGSLPFRRARRTIRMGQVKWLPNRDAIRHVRFSDQSPWLIGGSFGFGDPRLPPRCLSDCGWRDDIVENR
jgi:hypothetical protein